MSPRMLFLMRMRGILRKEVLQIRRDPSSIALAILLPIALLFIFGYGVSLDAENVPLAMVLDDNGPAARELAARFDGSRYFDVNYLHSMAQAQEWLNTRKVDGIVHLQNDFSARLARAPKRTDPADHQRYRRQPGAFDPGLCARCTAEVELRAPGARRSGRCAIRSGGSAHLV